MINSDIQLIVREIKKNIPLNIVSIILFGSAVKSVKTAEDYDFLIVTKKKFLQEWVLAGIIKNNLLGKIGKPIDLVFLEEKDLKYGSPFLYEVSKKSKLIFGNDISRQLKKVCNKINPLIKGGSQVGWQVA